MPPVKKKLPLKSTIAILHKAQRLLDGFKEEFAKEVLESLKRLMKRGLRSTSRTRPLNDSDYDYYEDEPVGVYPPGSLYPMGGGSVEPFAVGPVCKPRF